MNFLNSPFNQHDIGICVAPRPLTIFLAYTAEREFCFLKWVPHVMEGIIGYLVYAV
jgi:hypothetical protein